MNESASPTTTKIQTANGIDGFKIKTKSVGTGAKPDTIDFDVDDVKLYSYYDASAESVAKASNSLVFNFEAEGENAANYKDGGGGNVSIKADGDANKVFNLDNKDGGISYLGFVDTENVLGQAKKGSSYVINYKLRVNGGLEVTDAYVNSGNTLWWLYAGGLLLADTYKNDDSCYYANATVNKTDKTSMSIGSVAINADEWVDLTIYAYVSADANADGKMTIYYQLFVNGTRVSKQDAKATEIGPDIFGLGVKFMGASYFVGGYNIDIDDIEINAYHTN